MNNDGCLTRDGFAVAMHLIQKKLAGTDIPSTLPPSLLPPSMRAKNSSPFSPSISHSPEAAKDLLGDDTPPPSAVPPQPPRPTPTVTRDPFASSAHNGKSVVSLHTAVPSYCGCPQHHPIGIYSVMMMMTSRVLPFLCMINLQRLATFKTNSTQPLAHWIARRMNE